MNIGRRWTGWIAAAVLWFALVPGASAQVSVITEGDTAYATISLTGNNGQVYEADVTIVFDNPVNLTPQSLNLVAEIVNPDDLLPRLPPPPLLGLGPPPVTVDPAFPVMITIEPPDITSIFTSGFNGNEDGTGILGFLNTYAVEIHTHNLQFVTNSEYRVFKAPIGENFYDITNDVLAGSVRVRGRGPAFSQFIVVDDTRAPLAVWLDKFLNLQLAVVSAIIDDVLQLDLLQLLAKIQVLVLVDLDAAIAALDELIADVEADAGTEIANVWTARRDTTNDAGEILTRAQTLRFTLVRMQQSLQNP